MLALGSGLIGGIFFAFSSFIMKALARVPPTHGIAVMQSINVSVLNIWFFAVFFGTGACCLVLGISSLFRWEKPGAGYLLAGSVLYLIGTIIVTIACNVPLNDALAAVDPSSADAGRVWGGTFHAVANRLLRIAAALFIVGLCRDASPFDLLDPKRRR